MAHCLLTCLKYGYQISPHTSANANINGRQYIPISALHWLTPVGTNIPQSTSGGGVCVWNGREGNRYNHLIVQIRVSTRWLQVKLQAKSPIHTHACLHMTVYFIHSFCTEVSYLCICTSSWMHNLSIISPSLSPVCHNGHRVRVQR